MIGNITGTDKQNMKITTTQTLKHFIEELEADLNDLAIQMNDELDAHCLDDNDDGWHETHMEQLNDDYEEKQEHLSNLKTLLSSLLSQGEIAYP